MNNELNETISYDEMEELDDCERDSFRRELRDQQLAAYDTGGEYRVGWLWAEDGAPLIEHEDEIFATEQPARSLASQQLAEADGQY